MESIHRIWAVTIKSPDGQDVDYSLAVKDNKFMMYRAGKPFMTYVDELHKWVGGNIDGSKAIMIDWLSLRDICELSEFQFNTPYTKSE